MRLVAHEHMNNIETELKIALTKDEYDELLSVGNTKPQLQTNYYFYCDVMPRDTVVRVRKKQGEYLLCYKRLLESANGINVCDEREQPLDEHTATSFINDGLSALELKRRLGVESPLQYRCIGSLDTYRAKFLVKHWMLELDKSCYLGVTDYELECEYSSVELLGKLKDYLLNSYGIAFKPSCSKSGRFFDRYFKNN